jgi:predicted nucleotidyltransferase
VNFDLHKHTVFLVLSGSHAYGMATPTSDYDYKGIVIPPMSSYIGLIDSFENSVGLDVYKHYPIGLLKDDPRVQGAALTVSPDMQVMEIAKFARLALANNPSVIETLFTDESEVLVCHPILKPLIENRDKMLSKQAKARFCGYAVSQLNRIKRHKRWLDNPPKHKPTRDEFGLPEQTLISQDQIGAANTLIQKEIDEFMIDQTHLPEDVKVELGAMLGKSLRATWQALHTNVPYPVGDDQRFESTEDALYWGAAKDQGFTDNFLEVLVREKRYRTAKREWDQYQTWLKQRNPARAELEKKFGFDCYADDTEFLTEFGWKKFDDIPRGTRLATVFLGNMTHRSHLQVEYQIPIDRFDGKIESGSMYHFTGNHLDVMVTPNHNMLIRPVSRKLDEVMGLQLLEAAALGDCFEFLRAPNPRKTTFSNKALFEGLPVPLHVYLMIMGWYLSDGCITFKDGKPNEIRISQKRGGKLHWHMSKYQGKWGSITNSSLYEYTNPPNGFRKEACQEMVLSIRNQAIVDRIAEDCRYLKDKKVPRWAFGLSKRLIDILLLAMHRGDGTDSRPDNSKIYYSSLKGLADDFQELALMAGYETSLYGPYGPYPDKDTLMYQVHWNTTRERFKRFIRNNNLTKVPVNEPKRIVCFTVPNGTLITRRNGHVAIHGNSKHASHLVRLLRMAREILQEGVVRVKRPDAEELLAIRRGTWSYEQIIEFAEREDEALNEVVKNCKLPKVPDMHFFDDLVREIILKFNRYRLYSDD